MNNIVFGVAFLCLIALNLGYPTEDVENLDTKVIGGQPTPAGTTPFMVSLQVRQTDSIYGKFCGGTILAPTWVLTAGHCIPLYKQHGGGFFVRAGIVDAYDNNATYAQLRQVNNVYVHPNYTSGVAPHDLALLELKTPFKMTARVQPLPLPPAGYIPSGDALIIGWGDTLNLTNPKNLERTDVLLHVRAPIIPVEECQKYLRGVTLNHVCPGSYMKTQCGGDSGGPLVQPVNGRFSVVGVASFSMRPCGLRAGAYVRTSAYIDDFINPGMAHAFPADYVGDDGQEERPIWN